jgi:hypothetical protein
MTKSGKEYGKLTAEQFKRLIDHLPEIRNQPVELADAVRRVPKDRLEELLPNDYSWAAIYELSFIEHMAMLVLALDKVEFLKGAKESEDPQQVILDDFKFDAEEWNGGWQGAFEKKHVIGLTFALQRSILSVMIFQKTMSTLVDEARQGSLDSLLNAVRIDRSAVACPVIAARIAKAELMSEKEFFLHLRKALKGPSQKHWQSYQDLRYALYVLRDLGFDKLSDDQLEDLLVRQLKVYPNTFNARRNLRKQYTLSKKINHLK